MTPPAAGAAVRRESSSSTEAAHALFERHRRRIYAFCLSRTRNGSDAEDATQTTFMYALRGLQRGVVPEFELSWLLRIAENVCHSQRRRAHRRYERDELPADVTSHGGDPAVVSERLATLSSALEQLPETQRRALILREWRGLSYHDIAAELQLSHAAVETLLFRARRSLAKRVASAGTVALQLMPAASRLTRSLLATGAGKAAVVAATATAIGSGIAAKDVLTAREEPARARPAPYAAVEPVPVPVRPGRDAETRAAGRTEERAVPRVDAAVAAGAVPASPEPVGPSSPEHRSTDGASSPAPAGEVGGVMPVVTVAPVDDVVDALQPVEEATEPVVDVVRGLEPVLEDVVAELEPVSPSLPVAEELPALDPPEPNLPPLP